MKNTHDNTILTTSKQNNTKLTQFWKQTKLTWNRARQTIVIEIQDNCRMKNDKQAWEYNEKHITHSITTSNQTTLDSLNLESKPTSLGMVPIKLLSETSK